MALYLDPQGDSPLSWLAKAEADVILPFMLLGSYDRFRANGYVPVVLKLGIGIGGEIAVAYDKDEAARLKNEPDTPSVFKLFAVVSLDMLDASSGLTPEQLREFNLEPTMPVRSEPIGERIDTVADIHRKIRRRA